MCFINDYDWIASVYSDTEEVADVEKRRRCYECHRHILPGEKVRDIFMQEHDECIHNPLHEDYDGPETDSEECPEGCEHDYGETFACSVCLECAHLLDAIEAVELEAGCRGDELRPGFGKLRDAMWEDEDGRYRRKALELHPEIAEHLAMYYPERHED